MIKIKSLILDSTNWLEATWVDEVTTVKLVDKEVDGVMIQEEEIETTETQVHCESYSGHSEHISMLRAKALEFGTPLDEYESLISECESNFMYPTQEELDKETNAQKVQEARSYLSSTAWYIERLNDPSSGKPIPQEVLDKRAEARLTINELEG